MTLTGDTGTLNNVTTMYHAPPRLHLFDLEDQLWFPATIRDLAGDYIHFVENKFALHRSAVRLMAEALQLTKVDHVVDLCSRGSGPNLTSDSTEARVGIGLSRPDF